MRQAYRIIPIYTADVSGVCSALYELGGMTVMHDPSGCNSTYNTHDEIRWYDQDSLIFISGLTDIDAIMGNDEKFLQDIEDATEELQPRFIALASSPIPFMNGTDFPGLARALTVGTGIPAFSVPTSGMHDYVYGAGLALAEIAKHFTGAGEEKNKGGSEHSIKTNDEKIPGSTGKSVKCVGIKSEMNRRKLNLLGVTPLDFGPQSIVDIMKKRLENQGWEIISTWAMGDTLETLAKAGEADVNLVVSSVGIPAANVLKGKFGTPFLVGTPVDGYVEKISDALAEMAEKVTGECRISEKIPDLWKVTPDQVIYISTESAQPDITVIGEPVTMGSLAAAIEYKYEKKVQLLCPLEITEGLLREGDQAIRGEESIEERLKTAKIIIADPLYRPICPETARFYELPHIAFSGRIYLRKIKEMYAHNLIKTT
nr:nitrogenase component 1 [Ruminococcus sp. 1001713B170207_170306_F5]